MGAEVEETDAYVDAYAREGGLRGGRVNLDVVSVGATINIMIASVLVPGQTVIENAAKEPHIVDLANFLNTMGAKISGAGTDVIKIRESRRYKAVPIPSSPTKLKPAPTWQRWRR